MNITIKGEPKEISVHTVSVIPSNDKAVYLFNCIHCGNSIASYQGTVSKIMPILEPTNEAVIIARCKNKGQASCKSQYTFQSAQNTNKPVKVVLSYLPYSDNDFHCFKCRASWFSFDGKALYLSENGQRQGLPYNTHCKNTYCTVDYTFTDIV